MEIKKIITGVSTKAAKGNNQKSSKGLTRKKTLGRVKYPTSRATTTYQTHSVPGTHNPPSPYSEKALREASCTGATRLSQHGCSAIPASGRHECVPLLATSRSLLPPPRPASYAPENRATTPPRQKTPHHLRTKQVPSTPTTDIFRITPRSSLTPLLSLSLNSHELPLPAPRDGRHPSPSCQTRVLTQY